VTSSTEKKPVITSEAIKDAIIEAVDDMKGIDVVALDIKEVSNFADYMVVASGTSDTHVRAIAVNVATDLKEKGMRPIGEEGSDVSEWVLVDFGDVILHVMRPEVREFYDLEKLWDSEVRKLLEESRD